MWNFVLKNSQKKVSKWGVWYFKSGGLGGFGQGVRSGARPIKIQGGAPFWGAPPF